MTGIIYDNRDAGSLRDEVATYHQLPGKKLYEERGAAVHDYTCRSYPFTATNPADYHTITYYDDYSILSHWPAEYQYVSPGGDFESSRFEKVKGLVTATKTKILNTNSFIYTVNYYDDEYNLIQTVSENHLGGYDRISMQYDFRGKVLNEITEHHVDKDADGGLETTTLAQRYEYDHAERLKNTWHKVNSEPEILLSSLEYYESGQMAQKQLHSTDDGSTFLQTVDYDYNIRGWLTSSNNPDNLDNDLFAMRLHYNDITKTSGLLNDPQYNGNIAGMEWKTARGGASSNAVHRGYGFGYDALNRLKGANYGELITGNLWDLEFSSKYDIDMDHDLNGNITEIKRRGEVYAMIDDLEMTYDGNRLLNVSDASSDDLGFKDGVNQETEYTYDANGNMTNDYNKGLEHITYNHLNLPERFMITGVGSTVNNVYDAAGNKLSFIKTNGTAQLGREYIGSFIVYIDIINYQMSMLHMKTKQKP